MEYRRNWKKYIYIRNYGRGKKQRIEEWEEKER
jgi:hypothetical protein